IKLAQNTNDGYTVVTEGLSKGDLVVKTGMQNLKSDSQINVIDDKSTQDKPVTSNAGASTDSSSAPSTDSTSSPSTDSSSAPNTDSSLAPNTDQSSSPNSAPNAKGAQ
ncbi:MAG: efflux RND transporter periplasmic adaptor subunit, partial [Shewanella sp.]